MAVIGKIDAAALRKAAGSTFSGQGVLTDIVDAVVVRATISVEAIVSGLATTGNPREYAAAGVGNAGLIRTDTEVGAQTVVRSIDAIACAGIAGVICTLDVVVAVYRFHDAPPVLYVAEIVGTAVSVVALVDRSCDAPTAADAFRTGVIPAVAVSIAQA